MPPPGKLFFEATLVSASLWLEGSPDSGDCRHAAPAAAGGKARWPSRPCYSGVVISRAGAAPLERSMASPYSATLRRQLAEEARAVAVRIEVRGIEARTTSNGM